MRRFVATTAIVLGTALILAPAVLHLFSRTSAAERLTDDLRPAMTDQALAQTRSEFDTQRAGLQEFIDRGIPRIAADLGQTPEQFRASIDGQFPAVATGIDQLPTMATAVDGDISLFDANRAKFDSADAIPTTWLPYTVGPWMLIGFGALLVLLGLAVALGRGGRGSVVALLVVGLFLAVTPIAVRFPQKASDGRQLVALLKSPLSRQSADQVRAWQTTVENMTAELQDRLLPSTAGRLGLSPAGMDAYLARNLPALASALPQTQSVVRHMGTLVDKVEADVAPFATTSKLPFRGLTWLFFAPGVLSAFAAAALLLGSGSRARSGASRRADLPVETPAL
jgi:hypothetical protein